MNDIIKRLDRATLVTILIALVDEFPVVRECIKRIFEEHFSSVPREVR